MPSDIVELRERRLVKLKPAQVARELMGIPAKNRLKLIVERPDAQSVVAALDVNDFFYTVLEIGADDSLPLLALASIEQMNHLFDIDWWRKDTVEPAKALIWIERLRKAGGSKLLEWLSSADFELLVSLFKQWIVVDIAPEDIDLVEAAEKLPPRTLDDLYFWESRYPQYDDLITHLLTTVFETNYGFFKELMNSVLYASTPEVEESAYHFHRARLEDHAIPDFYDALEIYRSIGPDEFALKKVPPKADRDQPIPSFALALLSKGDLFAGVVSRIEDPGLLEILQLEMAALTNKVIVADRLSLDNADGLRLAVEKALAYVNLGLELRSGANIEKAEATLCDNFLEHLFRLAQAEVAKIRGRLQWITQSGWLSQCTAGVKCIDGEWFDAAEELLAKTPRILKSRLGGSVPGVLPAYDFFRTPEDLARGSHIVDVITCAGDLYQLLSAHTSDPGQRLWTDGQVRAPEDITLGVMVLTAAANSLISGKWRAAPLARAAWPEVFSFLQPHAIDRAVMDWVDRSVPNRERKSLGQAYLTPILRDYDLEMRPFSAQNPPEMHLVKFFMFSE
ncbi:MAG TPA: DUF6178 family protein [Syntrophobacteraceae bacterium]|nr:DUF6178 family protein [Syntrophobacteraceae bacterium]